KVRAKQEGHATHRTDRAPPSRRRSPRLNPQFDLRFVRLRPGGDCFGPAKDPAEIPPRWKRCLGEKMARELKRAKPWEGKPWGRNMKKKKTTYKPFDRAAYLDNDSV